MTVDLLGVPFNGDGTPPERENPAAAMRQRGLARHLVEHGAGHIVDHGDLEIPRFANERDQSTAILNVEEWKRLSVDLAGRLATIRRASHFVVVLGGDCSILLGVFGSFRNADQRVGLLVLDGHADYRDPQNSPTGEAADLDLSILTGRGPSTLVELFGPGPLLRQEDVALVGYRDPDQIEESVIPRWSAESIRSKGIETVMDEVIASLSHVDRVWIHFDVDVLDPVYVPVMFPEPGGLGLDDVERLLFRAASELETVGLSLACYHPDLDPDHHAADRIVTLLAGGLGRALTSRLHIS